MQVNPFDCHIEPSGTCPTEPKDGSYLVVFCYQEGKQWKRKVLGSYPTEDKAVEALDTMRTIERLGFGHALQTKVE